MAIIYSYPQATPSINDMVLGVKFKANKKISTNSFYISDLVALIQSEIGTTPTLQQVLDNNHNLVDDNNFQGTLAGNGNTGISVNAFGNDAASSNTGYAVNALGANAANANEGGYVNALGPLAAQLNQNDNINAFGNLAAFSNQADNVNAFGNEAGNGNVYKNVNLFGENAQADEDGQTVLSKDGAIMARISTIDLTDTRKYNLPDADGTIALTSDLSSFVPYTGAVSSLNMGDNDIILGPGSTTRNITVNTLTNGGITATSSGSNLRLAPDYLRMTDTQAGGSLTLDLRPNGLTTGNDFTITLPAAAGTVALLSNIVQFKSSSFTATPNQYYYTSDILTVTDPPGLAVQGYIVYVVYGTTTIGGVGYTAGSLIYRYQNGTTWASTNMANPTPAYKVYTALLTQTGTSAPVADVLENTLGFTITWVRTSAGTYQTQTLAAPQNKIWYYLKSGVPEAKETTMYFVPSKLQVQTYSLSSGHSITSEDNKLNLTPIEIRIYN